MKKFMRKLFGIVVLVAPTFTVQAVELELSLPIKEVTVHPETAIVTRRGPVSIPAGEHTLVISGLPKNLDPARFRLSVEGESLVLGGIDILKVHQVETNDIKEQQLERELLNLLDQRKVMEDEKAIAQSTLLLIQSLASGGDKAQIKTSLNPNDINSLFKNLAENNQLARTTIREAEVALRQLAKRIEQKQHEKTQNKASAVIESVVKASVRVESNYLGQLSLDYPEEKAYWDWVYEARLDTDSKKLQLFRQVEVVQYTGEPWQNVELTITTATATANSQTPELDAATINIYDIEEEYGAGTSYSRKPARGGLVGGSDALEEVIVTGSYIRHDPAEVIASQYLVEYRIPGSVSIPSSEQSKILPIDQKNFTVDLIARTVPIIDTNAYLEAAFSYSGDIPIQTGELHMYRDGAYVGEGYLPAMLPDKTSRIPFGKDELVKVELRQQGEANLTNRSFGRKNVEDIHYHIELMNFHQSPIMIEVLDRIPIALNGKIDLEFNKDSTPFDEKDIDGKKGVNLWRQTVEPTKKAVINYHLSIEYPKYSELEFEEEY